MRSRALTFAIVPLAALVLACGVSTSKNVQGPGAQNPGPPSTAASGKAGKAIVLEVSGPKAADITYGLGIDQSQANSAALPWRKELTAAEEPIIVSIVAQSKGTGKIMCRITVDGKLVKENASEGPYATVTCSNA